MKAINIKLIELKAKQKDRQIKECNDLLTNAGVPGWVLLYDSDVPSNSIVSRLKYFLYRRKNLKKSEIDSKLDQEMREMFIYAQNH